MKKIIIFLFIAFTFAPAAFCASTASFNVNNNKSYILLIDDAALDVKFSTPDILKAFPVVTLDSDRQQVLIQTLAVGAADIDIKTPSLEYKYKFNVVDNPKEVYENLLELDLPDEVAK